MKANLSTLIGLKTLVTHGLYSRIQNPIYLFGGLFTAGISVLFSVTGPLMVAAFLIPSQVIRARKEEHVLTKAFGEDYLSYKRQTWF